MFEEFFEDVQRRGRAEFSRERVPESGGRDTESSVAEGTESGVRSGEQACVRGAKLSRTGVGMEEVGEAQWG